MQHDRVRGPEVAHRATNRLPDQGKLDDRWRDTFCYADGGIEAR